MSPDRWWHLRAGWMSGLIGVIIFSGSLPATRVAVMDLPPLFLTSFRAVAAALLAALLLIAKRERLPGRSDAVPLLIVAAGVVGGFPLLAAMALKHISAGHSLVFVGLLPLTTSAFAVVRGGERPRPTFWLFSAMGAAIVTTFAMSRSGSASLEGDLLMVGAILLCGLGYAEGALLSRRLGGWQVISWALLVSLPLMLVPMIVTKPVSLSTVGAAAWAGVAYISVFSMLVAFIFWYRGLAIGGVASVAQLQLLQPFLGLLLSALVLHEEVSPSMLVSACFVMLCVAGARRCA